MAASFTSARHWQQTDGTSLHDPLVDSWIERPCCGNPMCVYTTMDWNSTANDSSGSKPTERGPPAGIWPCDPWPLGMDFHWVLGSNLVPLMAARLLFWPSWESIYLPL